VNGPVTIADGVTLEPGDDGRLPVAVRWARALTAPEAFAVDGDVVYAADEVLWAFRLSDGSVKWEAEDSEGEGLGGSGAVVIGLNGPDQVRAWAPWEYDFTVDRQTGSVISHEIAEGEDTPTGMTIFPAPSPSRFRVEMGLEEIVAHTDNGDIAWRIVVADPQFDEQPAVEVPGGLALTTSSGHLVVLDYR